MKRQARFILLGLMGLWLLATPAFARDVAFVEPGSAGGSGTPDEAFKIEPKSEIDIGDAIINIVRRQTLFYVNQTSAPIKIEKIAISSDSTVAPLIVNDDCSKQGTIAPLSRCSLELSITPTGPGAWSIEVLMTHNGTGRITRARIGGKTAGSDNSEKKEHGLFLSTKDVKGIDFGEVGVGSGKIVRSALMVNDSPSPITIYSIDVIEADKSLQRNDQGCAPDMDLKPGESCPVTLVWTPTSGGLISTDMIIRHSGQLGFAVIPVRGTAKGAGKEGGESGAGNSTRPSGTSSSSNNASGNNSSSETAIAPPPTPSEVAREVAKAVAPARSAAVDNASVATGSMHLIGTVGNRAVLLKPDGSTTIVQKGDAVSLGGSQAAYVDDVGATSATLTIDGKKKTLQLEAVQELKDRALASQKSSADSGTTKGKDGGSGGLGASTR